MPVLALVLSELAGAYFNPSAAAMKAGVACLFGVVQDRVFLLHSSQCLLTSAFMSSVGSALPALLQIYVLYHDRFMLVACPLQQ